MQMDSARINAFDNFQCLPFLFKFHFSCYFCYAIQAAN